MCQIILKQRAPLVTGLHQPVSIPSIVYESNTPRDNKRTEAGQPLLNPEVNLGFDLEPWDPSLLSGIPDELFADDTIFGIFGG